LLQIFPKMRNTLYYTYT